MKRMLLISLLILVTMYLYKTNPDIESFKEFYYEKNVNDEVQNMDDFLENIAVYFNSLTIEQDDYKLFSVFNVDGNGFHALGFANDNFVEISESVREGLATVYDLMWGIVGAIDNVVNDKK